MTSSVFKFLYQGQNHDGDMDVYLTIETEIYINGQSEKKIYPERSHVYRNKKGIA